MPLRLKPDPTFWSEVKIPLPGGKVEIIECEFVHMNQDEYTAYQPSEQKDVADQIKRIVKNWKGVVGEDGEALEFNSENIKAILFNYHGAGRAIGQTFVNQLLQVRLGN